MWKAIASTSLSLFVVLLFLFAGAVGWGVRQWEAPGPLADSICIEVSSGSKMGDVVAKLEAQEAVTSSRIFEAGVDYSGRAKDLKAGSFLIPAGASMESILGIVTGTGKSTCGSQLVWRVGVTRTKAELRELDPATGSYTDIAEWIVSDDEPEPAVVAQYRDKPDLQYSVILAEGVTSWQVLSALNDIDLLVEPVETVPAEGSLAPRDYALERGATVQSVIDRMQETQAQILEEVWQARAADAAVTTPEEALILASIIEKETGVPEERFDVASVFTNRLNQGIRLQTDPTVIYGITLGREILGRGLRRSELDRRTDWNTYQIDGLPPTPIANPGIESLRAAVNPAQTDYIFFVADGTGGHAFAKTLEEHNENVARWRAIEAQRSGN